MRTYTLKGEREVEHIEEMPKLKKLYCGGRQLFIYIQAVPKAGEWHII